MNKLFGRKKNLKMNKIIERRKILFGESSNALNEMKVTATLTSIFSGKKKCKDKNKSKKDKKK